MLGAIGTALGGVCTLIPEPQYLLGKATWNFFEFFIRMSPPAFLVSVWAS